MCIEQMVAFFGDVAGFDPKVTVVAVGYHECLDRDPQPWCRGVLLLGLRVHVAMSTVRTSKSYAGSSLSVSAQQTGIGFAQP